MLYSAIEFMGSASSHFMKKSIVPDKYLCSLEARGKGLTMSNPQHVKGTWETIIVSSL